MSKPFKPLDPRFAEFLRVFAQTFGNGWIATASGSRPLAEYSAALSTLTTREARAGYSAVMKARGTVPPSPATFVQQAREVHYRKAPGQLERGRAAIANAKDIAARRGE